MNEETARRREVARKIATTAALNPKVVAVALVGSTARGNCDVYSDIDMSIYYSERPTKEELEEFRARLDMRDWQLLGGVEGEEDIIDAWVVDGVDGQSGHVMLSGFEELLDDVLHRYDTDHDKHTILGGIAEAIPLYGEEIVERLKGRVAYPDELAAAMVRNHLKFRPLWYLEHRFGGRDTLFPFHQVVIDYERRILGILLGLNRLYPEHDFKRLGNLTEKLAIAPPDLDARLRKILRADYPVAARELGTLIEDTLALVEEHMPEVDTGGVRGDLAKKDPGKP